MTKSVAAFSFLFFCLISQVIAQRNSDIGIHISTFDEARIGLEYRIPLNDTWRFHVGAVYGNVFRPGRESILSSSVDTVVQRSMSLNETNGTLRLGLSHQWEESIFSIGANVLLGYELRKNESVNIYQIRDSLNQWNTSFPDLDDELDAMRGRASRSFFVPGFQLLFNVDIPVNERIDLNLNLSAVMNAYVSMRQFDVVDPLGEYDPRDIGEISFDSVAGIGLRYKIGDILRAEVPN